MRKTSLPERAWRPLFCPHTSFRVATHRGLAKNAPLQLIQNQKPSRSDPLRRSMVRCIIYFHAGQYRRGYGAQSHGVEACRSFATFTVFKPSTIKPLSFHIIACCSGRIYEVYVPYVLPLGHLAVAFHTSTALVSVSSQPRPVTLIIP